MRQHIASVGRRRCPQEVVVDVGSPAPPPRSAAARRHVCVGTQRHNLGVSLTKRSRWGAGLGRRSCPPWGWATVGRMRPRWAGSREALGPRSAAT